MLIEASQLAVWTVDNQQAPTEGSKYIPINLDFNLGASFELYLRDLQQINQFSMVQGIFFDNSLNNASVVMTNYTSGQKIICPAASQGYAVVIAPNPAQMKFESTGNVRVPVFLLNFPVASAFWHV